MAEFQKTADTFVPGSRVLSREYYTSPEIFNDEMRVFVHENPLCVGHVSDIPDAGSYFLYNIDTESLIITRGTNGDVNAFHNVCPHRTIRMIENPVGRLNKVVQCDYHAMTFEREAGSIINPMALKQTEGVDPSRLCLQKSAVKVWNGFIFVNLDPGRPMDFDQVFPYLPDFSKYYLNNLELGAVREYDVRANFKTIFQNYQECGHCALKHEQLVRVCGYTEWFNDITEGAILGGYMYPKNGFADLTMTGNLCAPLIGDLNSEEKKRLYAYSFSPGMLLLGVHPDYVNYDLIIPVAVDRTRIISKWLFKNGSNESPGFNPIDAIDFWHLTNQQDFLDIVPRVQEGSNSRYYRPGPLASNESLVAAYDRHYQRVMNKHKTRGISQRIKKALHVLING